MTKIEMDQAAADLLTIDNNTPDYAIVHRVDINGANGLVYCGKVSLTIMGDDDEAVNDHIRGEWGPGTYKIDYRISGKKGSAKSPRTVTVSAPFRSAEPDPFNSRADRVPLGMPAPQLPQDVLLTLLTSMMQSQTQVMVAMLGKSNGMEMKDILPLLVAKTPANELIEFAKLSKNLTPGVSAGGDGGLAEMMTAGATALQAIAQLRGDQSTPLAPLALPDRSFAPSSLAPARPVPALAAPFVPPAPAPAARVPSISPGGAQSTVVPPGDVDNDEDGIANRMQLVVSMLMATAGATDRDAECYAQVFIDTIGVEQSDALTELDDNTAVGFIVHHFPQLEPQRAFLSEVVIAIRSMIVDPPPGPTASAGSAQTDAVVPTSNSSPAKRSGR